MNEEGELYMQNAHGELSNFIKKLNSERQEMVRFQY